MNKTNYRQCDFESIKNEIKKLMEDAYENMGYTGDEDYWEKATKEQIYQFGKYRVLEDLLDDFDLL